MQTQMENQRDVGTNDLVDRNKDKIRIHERNERELAITVRELREEIEKQKTKIHHFENQKADLSRSVEDKDRVIKEMEAAKKRIEENLEDTGLESSALQKRIELKESAHKEHMKKMTERYNQSEKER